MDAADAGMFDAAAEEAPPVFLSRQQILDAQDITYEVVHVPGWGGHVRVKSMTGHERDQLEASMVLEKHGERSMTMDDFRAKVCAATVVDAAGDRLFSEADIKALSRKSAGSLAQVAEVGTRLAGMSKNDVKAIEADLKNDHGAGS